MNKINLKQDNEKTSNKTLISNREIEFKVNSYDKMIVDLKSFYEAINRRRKVQRVFNGF